MSENDEVDEFFRRVSMVRGRLRSIRRKTIQGVVKPRGGLLGRADRILAEREKELTERLKGRKGFSLTFNRPLPPPPPPLSQPPQPLQPEKNFVCNICSESFLTNEKLEFHQRQGHKTTIEKIMI